MPKWEQGLTHTHAHLTPYIISTRVCRSNLTLIVITSRARVAAKINMHGNLVETGCGNVYTSMPRHYIEISEGPYDRSFLVLSDF